MQDESLLQAIHHLLEKIRASRSAPPAVPLGFGSAPKPRYIYANRQYPDCLWYFLNGPKNEHEPIEHTALTGYLEKLELDEKEFRGKPKIKVNLTLRADRLYVIQAGFETLFARGLIYSLSKMPQEAFRKPIMISVEAGDSDQVLFCKIYNPVNGKPFFVPYPEDTDWQATAQQAIAKIQKVHEEP